MSARLQAAKSALTSGLGIVIMLAILRVILHTLINDQYGFHRDELQVFDDARYLDWGYVPYPPVTPLIAALARAIFGESLVGLRLFSALAQAGAMIAAALIAREMDGKRLAQIVAGVSVAIMPPSIGQSSLFEYVSFDFLWQVLIALFVARLIRTENPRWWLAIGAAIGLGMMTRYSMAFFVAGLVLGFLLTSVRRQIASPWLWAGATLAALIYLPNLLWQIRHDFISLDFLSAIHERDIARGRTLGFVSDQFFDNASPVTILLWIAGLWFVFFAPDGKRFRMLGWTAVGVVALLAIMQGRGYYTIGVFPMLLAAGARFGEGWLETRVTRGAGLIKALAGSALTIGGALAVPTAAPVVPINSPLWDYVYSESGNFRDEIGWPDLVETIAGVYNGLPAEQRARTGILGANYGEAGAINLYGPRYGLPEAISGINTYPLRGYGDPPPKWLIVVGATEEQAGMFFKDCEWAAANTNRYGVKNEESVDHPDIFLCGEPHLPWPEMWKDFQWFG